MAFGWLVAFLNNCISTNIYGRFESFRFFNQEITLVAGLVRRTAWSNMLTDRRRRLIGRLQLRGQTRILARQHPIVFDLEGYFATVG